MLLGKLTTENSPNLLEIDEDVRANRASLLMKVMFLTWLLFFGYFTLRGYQRAALICVSQFPVYFVLQSFLQKKRQFLTVMTFYFIYSGLGIFLISISDPRLQLTGFFFTVSIVVTSNLFGIRQTTIWFVFCIIQFAAHYYLLFGVTETLTNHLDAFIISLGVTGCIFFCCHQAESSYQSKTQRLIDVSKRLQQRSTELETLATTDSLTGLTNRFQFQNELDAAVKAATAENQFALFLIDMDGFKEINDTLGHATGDEVLVEVANRLSCELGARARVARLGGDEFCILFEKIGGYDRANEVAKNIHNLLISRYQLSDIEVTLGTSVGYALCPDDAIDPASILSFADTAMYHAKHHKLRVAQYESEMTDRIRKNLMTNERLSVALERNEFSLVYQPQFDTRSNKIFGAEALLRWHSDDSTMSPSHFVPMLESTGRIVPVSKWLIREACRQQAQWLRNGVDTVISVNISALQFKHDGFVNSVIEPLEEFGLSPSKFELEITEGILIDDVEQVTAKLTQLKELGCRISIDDFGTGYSSLAYLRQFPLDKLKIDRAFVKDIPERDDGVIASGIIMLAELLDLEVIAEGVETKAQLDFLRQNGCSEIQGFYFSKPLRPNEFFKLAVEHSNAIKQPAK